MTAETGEMRETDLACVVLAAGKGTRMRSQTPKVLHKVGGRAMLHHVLDACLALEPRKIVTVVGSGAEQVAEAVQAFSERCAVAVQEPQLGTGHAVQAAADALTGAEGDALIVYGDNPLITSATLRAMLEARREGAAIVVLGFRPDDPGAYGRLVCDGEGALDAIVEAKEASPEQLAIRLCNSGVMAVEAGLLFDLLAQVTNNNAKGEYYLTDIVAIARARGLACRVVEADADEVMGVNARGELAEAEAVFQNRRRDEAMAAGVTLTDPSTVYFSWDTRIGQDVTVGPNVVFGPGAVVENNVEIRAFCHIEGARVGAGSIIGPFARLRPGASLGEGVHVGNFVEIKKSDLGPGAKVSHLSYIGDASVGARSNIGAGTITCNYDGFDKFRTEIGEGAFIGTNSALVAPVKIGDGAFTGAGSVITRDVPADALGLTRPEQRDIAGWAEKFRARKRAARAQQDEGASQSPEKA